MSIVLITAVFAALLALVLGFALGFFREFFFVAVDPLTANIREALPGANCGSCGYPGCDGYAGAVAKGEAGTGACTVGGSAVAAKLAALLGTDAVTITPAVSVLACRGSAEHAALKGEYSGVATCRAAKLSTGGTKLCAWGCLGYGDCRAVCKFGAISMGADGLPVIDRDKCTGCKACVAECPQALLKDVPVDRTGAMTRCSNRNPVRGAVRKACTAGCIKCEVCVKNCPVNCITMENGIPLVDYAKCTSCGTCAEKCPVKVMRLLKIA
ncbi:MAG: RnfABCDGE type electron transport complex subunit B [Spirochaetaceae bacterium]|jgi:Na+-translocating ferredoxin:NAD+ oxidoreductase RNF subunit RnfB|nr:RnfABCDGE type electron transport complex subunit B [Spirochaetaceae bacterium]